MKKEIMNILKNQVDVVIMSNEEYRKWALKNPISLKEQIKQDRFIKEYVRKPVKF
jgi:hypothetical protein